MHEAQLYPKLITQTINKFVANKREELEDLGSEIAPLLNETSNFLQGGKRLRGMFLIMGYEAISAPKNLTNDPELLETVLLAASSLEVFHAAALIHDDIIDKSETRRGTSSIHMLFKQKHEEQNFSGQPEHFGLSAALLIGDILQSWADELMNSALTRVTDGASATKARHVFNRMRSEVAAGQYLDVLEEMRSNFAEKNLQLERSTRVLIYKSAKYSIQAPLLLGAAMAGAAAENYTALANFGLPVGVAFQLRDDLLGVFGEEAITGKPTGDDLREGKRTILVTLAREELPSGPKNVFDHLFGSSDLDQEQVKTLQYTIEDSGAKKRVEEMITQNVGLSREALAESTLNADSVAKLLELANLATQRDL